MNHTEVLRRYAEQIPNRRTGRVNWRGHSVFAEGRVLYSYGHHFPMAVLLGRNEDAEQVFLKNGDRYSVTTSQHQGMVQRSCPGPTTSFDALERAGIDPLRVHLTSAEVSADEVVNGTDSSARLLDWREDNWTALVRESPESPWVHKYGSEEGQVFTRPDVGMLIPYPPKNGGPVLEAAWHILGAVLFLSANGRHILCVRDEGNYSAIQLSAPAWTVKEAVEGLKPEEVREAEARGAEVRRQGEWFAILRPDLTDAEVKVLCGLRAMRELRAAAKTGALPRRYIEGRGLVGAEHICPHVVTPAGLILARGVLRHSPDGFRARPEHRALRLGALWHQVERNTEVMSWGSHRRFD